MKNLVAELRQKKGWGQLDLANRLNISEAAVSRLENNQSKLDDVKLESLCRLFNCTPNDIFGISSRDIVKIEDLRGIILESLKYKGDLSKEQIAEVSIHAYIQSLNNGMTVQEFSRVLSFLPQMHSPAKDD